MFKKFWGSRDRIKKKDLIVQMLSRGGLLLEVLFGPIQDEMLYSAQPSPKLKVNKITVIFVESRARLTLAVLKILPIDDN